MITAPDSETSTLPEQDEACPATWFDGFTEGLRAEEALLAMLLPRVAPETTVVAAAALGLQRVDGALKISLEASIDHGPARVDMVVSAELDRRWAFEWKLLWQPGLGECVGGIRRDLEKLKGHPRSVVLVFAYAVREAPPFCATRVSKTPLSNTVESAIAKLGKPHRCSAIFTVKQFGTCAEWQVLAWVPSS